MSRHVSVYTVSLLSPDGTRPVIGGLERYLRDLAFLMKGLGYAVDFLQDSAAGQWTAEYLGFRVRGIPMVKGQSDLAAFDRTSGDKVLYGWIGQQQSYKFPGISICHGIWWDHPQYTESVADDIRRCVRPALRGCRYVAAVDTAFINWCRSTMPGEVQGKLRYIPNYVDLTRFSPREKTMDRDRLTVLYPRRIDFARGIELCFRVAPRVLQRYPQVRFSFAVDRNNEHLWQQFVAWVQLQPDPSRIEYRTFGFDQMPEAYREADIVICPSLMSEGTSFSCLEAMASGKPVLATVVGGLTDLILDRFNGRLVHPDDESVFEALYELVEDAELRRSLGHNAALTAGAFSKERWEARWSELLTKVY